MIKAKFKKAIKDMMKNYSFTLEQAVWSMHKLNPTYTAQIKAADLDLTADQMMGRL